MPLLQRDLPALPTSLTASQRDCTPVLFMLLLERRNTRLGVCVCTCVSLCAHGVRVHAHVYHHRNIYSFRNVLNNQRSKALKREKKNPKKHVYIHDFTFYFKPTKENTVTNTNHYLAGNFTLHDHVNRLHRFK